MPHSCNDWMVAGECQLCEVLWCKVNLLRRDRGWECVVDRSYRMDELEFELERLASRIGKRMSRDDKPYAEHMIHRNLHGRRVTVQIIPARTGAGFMSEDEVARCVLTVRRFQYAQIHAMGTPALSSEDTIGLRNPFVNPTLVQLHGIDEYASWMANESASPLKGARGNQRREPSRRIAARHATAEREGQ
ncbi:hypothetical protein BKA62DRAFT_671359 [Auriculariales sp. MPI-PUGE-AT-0066]|nr:hypothetical protein BKA62DRAFT_671359 [Auriculariales sp. MPI-PUGE-AT-0066]